MPATVEIVGLDKLLKQFEALSLKGQKAVDCQIGYSAPHAIFVHENLEARNQGQEVPRKGKDKIGVYWGRPYDSSKGQPKFLETAFRRLKRQTKATIKKMLKAHRSLEETILAAALPIFRLSNSMVPIDTADLLLSGFIKVGGAVKVTATKE